MSRWTKVSIFVTVVLIGIPSAASFYPPIFASLSDQLPINYILFWMGRAGIFSLGCLGGWWARGRFQGMEDTSDRNEKEVTVIEGCIQMEESCWKGTAEISNGKLSRFGVENRAICPNCQTVMYDGESGYRSVSGGLGLWECPNCGHTAFEEGSPYEDVDKLFERHVRQIAESEDEDYSLDNLINEIDGEATPRRIWEQYVKVVEDDRVSMNCFP